ncbi:uncharacterized protein A4U43_C08F11450 [Asparagus officinalis]|nr:uncharacterized protein A4U43_C08F11450 [Asparagus officinalis]
MDKEYREKAQTSTLKSDLLLQVLPPKVLSLGIASGVLPPPIEPQEVRHRVPPDPPPPPFAYARPRGSPAWCLHRRVPGPAPFRRMGSPGRPQVSPRVDLAGGDDLSGARRDAGVSAGGRRTSAHVVSREEEEEEEEEEGGGRERGQDRFEETRDEDGRVAMSVSLEF